MKAPSDYWTCATCVVSLQWGPAAQEAPCALQVAVCVWAPHLGQAWALPHQEQRQLPA